MPGNKDIGLGAVVSLRDSFSGPSRQIVSAVTKLEKRFGIAAGTITKSTKMMVAGIGLVVVGSLIRQGFAAPIKSATEFNNAMAEVSTLTNKTVGELGGLSNELINQSIALGQMPIESTKLLYQAISSGATSASDRLMVLDASQRAATAGLADQTDVLGLLSSAVKSYGKEWSAVTEISDLAFTTVKLGVTTIGELSTDMKKVLAPAAALGVEVKELFGAFATLTGVTGNTAEVSTQIRSVLVSLTRPTSQARKEAAKLGLDWSAQAVKAKGLQGVLMDLQRATGGNLTKIAKIIPRVEGLTAALALTGPQAEIFAQKLRAMDDSQGATQTAFEKMSKTMKFAQQQFASARQALSILVGQPLVDALRPAVFILSAMTIAIVKFASANPGFIKALTTFVFGASVIATIAGTLLFMKGALVLLAAFAPLALGAITAAFGSVLAMALPLAGLVTGLLILFKTFTTGRDSLGGGFIDIFKKGVLVWNGLTELIDTFDGRFGRMTASTANKLRKAGLLKLTAKIFAIWARGRAFFKGVSQGITGSIDAMAESIRRMLPAGSSVRVMFDRIANAISRLGLDSSISDWKDYGIAVGVVVPMILLGAFALSKVALFAKVVKAGLFLMSIGWKILGFTMFKIVPIAAKVIGSLLKMNPIIFLIGGAIIWLISRWDDLTAAFKAEGIVGALKVLLSDFIGFVVQIQRAIHSIPGIGSKIVSKADIKLTEKFQRDLLPDIVRKREDAEKKDKGFAPGMFSNLVPALPAVPFNLTQPELPGLDELRRVASEGAAPGVPRAVAPTGGIPEKEIINIILELDGDVVARAVEERDRRTALRDAD